MLKKESAKRGMVMSASAIMTAVYGAFSIIGGIIGYKQAGSKPSLIAGVITGGLLLLAALGMLQAQPWGTVLAIAVTALLVVTFIGRLIKTRKFMPAGLMVTLGVVTLVGLLSALG